MLFKSRNLSPAAPIPMKDLESHFQGLLGCSNDDLCNHSEEMISHEEREEEMRYNACFTKHEVLKVIYDTPNNKASGPDQLCYEHI